MQYSLIAPDIARATAAAAAPTMEVVCVGVAHDLLGTFNRSLMMSTDYLQSHLLVRLLRHQGPPCALIYHYQAVYLLPQGAVICLTRLSVGLPLQCYLAVAHANPGRR